MMRFSLRTHTWQQLRLLLVLTLLAMPLAAQQLPQQFIVHWKERAADPNTAARRVATLAQSSRVRLQTLRTMATGSTVLRLDGPALANPQLAAALATLRSDPAVA